MTIPSWGSSNGEINKDSSFSNSSKGIVEDVGDEDSEVVGSKRFDAVKFLEYESGGVSLCEWEVFDFYASGIIISH